MKCVRDLLEERQGALGAEERRSGGLTADGQSVVQITPLATCMQQLH